MKVRVFYGSSLGWLLSGGREAITLYPFVFISQSKETAHATRLIHHEWVHVEQVRRLGWWTFYAQYLKEYFKGLAATWDTQKAYENVSFEKEAHLLADQVMLPDGV